ncbi:MAG: tyrosine-type recombinase/integrase [Candidatus Bathyarchaeia archaeon]
MTQCPQCGSQKLWRDGLRRLAGGSFEQRWLCRNCSYRFTNTNHKRRTQWKNPPFSLNLESGLDYNCQGNNEPCGRDSTALGRAVQTLAEVEKENEKRDAGATTTSIEQTDAKSAIINFAWWMKKQGYAEQTIRDRCKILKIIMNRGANLFDLESVKDVIAKQNSWSGGRKEFAVDAYTCFLKMLGKGWNPPRYRRNEKLPFLPLESEIEQLIAGCSHKVGTFLQLLKETAVRPGEAARLEWTDLDPVNCTIRVSPEKGSNPRIFKVSTSLMERLMSLPHLNQWVFGGIKLKSIQKRFQEQRKRIAAKLKNSRLLRITFVTLRHWKATVEYAKTKDILHVMRLLGHKNIQNTLVYTHLVNFNDEEYVSRAAWTLEEAQKLVEAGFEYVCEVEGARLFRKRK